MKGRSYEKIYIVDALYRNATVYGIMRHKQGKY